MTSKSIADLNSQADATLNDNSNGEVSEADIRNMVKDLADSALNREDDIGSTVQSYDANTAKTDVVQSFSKVQRSAPFALTDGATISVDGEDSNYFTVTLGGNRTLQNPTNLVAGATYLFVITQDGTGSRTLAFGSGYLFEGGEAPTLTTNAGAVDLIVATAQSTTELLCTFKGDFS